VTRQTDNPKSPTELATEAVMARLNFAIAGEERKHTLNPAEFRRILAQYFERKQLREWYEDLGVTPRKGDT
jgi:hypothetical protein